MSTNFNLLPNEALAHIASFVVVDNYRDGDLLTGGYLNGNNFIPDQKCTAVFEDFTARQFNLLAQKCEKEKSNPLFQMIGSCLNEPHESLEEKVRIFSAVGRVLQSLGVQTQERVHTCEEVTAAIESVQDRDFDWLWNEIAKQIDCHEIAKQTDLIVLSGLKTDEEIRTWKRTWMQENPTHLKGVVHLNLASRNLHCLPREIGLLTEVRELDISGNQIAELPPEIGALQKLEIFDLSSNQLKKLPPEIGALQKLEVFDLSSNQLKKLPQEMAHLNLQGSFRGNPLEMTFGEIVAVFPSDPGLQYLLETNPSLIDQPFNNKGSSDDEVLSDHGDLVADEDQILLAPENFVANEDIPFDNQTLLAPEGFVADEDIPFYFVSDEDQILLAHKSFLDN
jgi:Leucine-rich repeat (LRR) protein